MVFESGIAIFMLAFFLKVEKNKIGLLRIKPIQFGRVIFCAILWAFIFLEIFELSSTHCKIYKVPRE